MPQHPEPIGIVGTGRLAKALGALFGRRGVSIAAVAGRCPEAARQAALFIGIPRSVSVRDLPAHARRILIAVADDALAQVGNELADAGLRDGIVLHTSGAADPQALEALRAKGNAVGVLHPLQTVPTPERGIATLPGAAFAYAGDAQARAWAEALIQRLGGKPLPISPPHWPRYHAAAVMASNYQATLVDAALELMESAGVTRDVALDALAPLIRTMLENTLRFGPERALTGPIRRGDIGTIRRHRAALETAAPATRGLYDAAGLRTLTLAVRSGLAPETAGQIETALRESVQQ